MSISHSNFLPNNATPNHTGSIPFLVLNELPDHEQSQYAEFLKLLRKDELSMLKLWSQSIAPAQFQKIINVRNEQRVRNGPLLGHTVSAAHEAKSKEMLEFLIAKGLEYGSTQVDNDAIFRKSLNERKFEKALYVLELGILNCDSPHYLNMALRSASKANRYERDTVSEETMTETKKIIYHLSRQISVKTLKDMPTPLHELVNFAPPYLDPDNFEKDNLFVQEVFTILLEKGADINAQSVIAKIAQVNNEVLFKFLLEKYPDPHQLEHFKTQILNDPSNYDKEKFLSIIEKTILESHIAPVSAVPGSATKQGHKI